MVSLVLRVDVCDDDTNLNTGSLQMLASPKSGGTSLGVPIMRMIL